MYVTAKCWLGFAQAQHLLTARTELWHVMCWRACIQLRLIIAHVTVYVRLSVTYTISLTFADIGILSFTQQTGKYFCCYVGRQVA